MPETAVERYARHHSLESQSSSVSSLVTLATPGIAADSNGLFHGLGDHAENSFSVAGQPITDQQSKVFSNQIPVDSIESMEVIAGAPPAEFGVGGAVPSRQKIVVAVRRRRPLPAQQPDVLRVPEDAAVRGETSRRRLIGIPRDVLGDGGSIVVYSQQFESQRLLDLASWLPEFSGRIARIQQRPWDSLQYIWVILGCGGFLIGMPAR